ncbi:nitrile hydratase accessory protein [Hansschlegelia plantiphila]|uniref:Nitrile hydratase beta subunit-like N-terminal domain-containing protein n=1 Tax=Hansschlegelia plantiphila TaxID=374655 RepID=A0A9W6J0P8_9HYPH|nr:nitrile hydratase accessory protein [Hansschlegelia plantiphila]GLK67611.1 hypothetical protein GCM10008179_12490 [Hansschlegelia plantiphila]
MAESHEGALNFLRRSEDGQTFREPWEASAFAMVVQLHQSGHFTWSEWADHLSAEIKHAERHGLDPDGKLYYQHWLAALEKLIEEKNILSRRDHADRIAHLKANPVPHDHVAKRDPIFVAAARPQALSAGVLQ